jgi:feruloyl esterase
MPFETSAQSRCENCDALKALNVPDVTIVSVESLERDTIRMGEFFGTQIISVPFCRVIGKISSEIQFELFLPKKWNGRFLMSGNGGFGGSFQNFLRPMVNNGFAVVSTDTGHRSENELVPDWAYNNMERQLNFGHLAVHRTTVVAKHLVTQFYCKPISFSYFVGCSRGGGQALMEAQRYPDDYDGIVAGAPAFSWPATAAKFVKECQANYIDAKEPTKPVITEDNLKLIQQIFNAQCDALDGIKDEIISDPRLCKIDWSKLPLCKGEVAGKDCFTKQQLLAFKAIYEPLVIDQAEVYPGYPVGLEAEPGGWDTWIAGTNAYVKPSLHHYFGTGVFKYFVFNDPSWDFKKYGFENFQKRVAYTSAFLDATDTNYTGFKKRKGKMILYHGWNDAALSAYSTIQYYERLLKEDRDAPNYIKFYLLPGVMHCDGGKGPSAVDWIKLMQDWVESNKVPDRVVASKIDQGKPTVTRPLYPYPQAAQYDGKGDPNQETSFKLKQ